MAPIVVYRGRTVVVPISLGVDVSGDTITSEIRTEAGVLIATWAVTNQGDGTDGKIFLTLDDLITADIDEPSGLTDLKRITNGEPVAVFEFPLEVVFRDTVTE